MVVLCDELRASPVFELETRRLVAELDYKRENGTIL